MRGSFLSFFLFAVLLSAPRVSLGFTECKDSDLVDVHMCNVKKVVKTRAKLCFGGVLSTNEPKDEDKCPKSCAEYADDPDANVGFMETECDRETSTKTRRFFYQNPLCVTGMLPLPVEGIPCHEVCPAGQFMDAHSRKCTKCAAGTYSRSGGDAYEVWNATAPFPWQFRRECIQAAPANADSNFGDCGGWVAAGKFAHSGRNLPPLNPNDETTYSALKLPVSLVRRGSVTFRFRVDAAPDDGLMFLIDGKNAMEFARGSATPGAGNAARKSPVAGPIKTTGNVTAFQEFTAPLEQGFHELKWVYVKNGWQTAGRDRAEIEAIEVVGTRWTGSEKDECVPCAPGSASDKEGALACDLCPPNTSAAGPGAKKCAPCDAKSEYAFEGSPKCERRQPCTSNDVQRDVSKCKDNKRTVTHKWREPKLCDDRASEGAIALPPDETTKCSPCAPGTAAGGQGSFACEPCKKGASSPGHGKECKDCPAGHAAVRALVLESFEEPKDYLVTNQCQGRCGTHGWVLTGDHAISSGRGHYDDVVVTIEFMLEFYTEGTLTFDWALECRDSCGLEVKRDYSQMWSTEELPFDELKPGPGRNGTRTAGPFYFDQGTHYITWQFRTSPMTYGRTTDHAIITRIEVTGVDGPWAGAPACTACGPGSALKTLLGGGNDRCTMCPPGSFASGDANAECTPCPVDTFSSHSGASKCRPCGPGTSTGGEAGASRCTTECRYMGRDLSPLAEGSMFGPVRDDATWLTAQGLGPTEAGRDAALPAYFVSVCRPPLPGNDSCIDDGVELGSLACRVSYDTMVSWETVTPIGEEVAFSPYDGRRPAVLPVLNASDAAAASAAAGPAEGGEGVVLTYSTFDYYCEGEKRELNITFVCDPDAGRGFPTAWPAAPVQEPACRYNMLWRSTLGCRECTDGDWVALTSADCVDGIARVEHVLKDGVVCYGGASVPVAGGVACANHVHVHVYLITVIAVLVIILGAAVVHVVLQNRRMYQEYSRLVASDIDEEGGGIPMQSSFTIGEPLEDGDDPGPSQ